MHYCYNILKFILSDLPRIFSVTPIVLYIPMIDPCIISPPYYTIQDVLYANVILGFLIYFEYCFHLLLLLHLPQARDALICDSTHLSVCHFPFRVIHIPVKWLVTFQAFPSFYLRCVHHILVPLKVPLWYPRIVISAEANLDKKSEHPAHCYTAASSVKPTNYFHVVFISY